MGVSSAGFTGRFVITGVIMRAKLFSAGSVCLSSLAVASVAFAGTGGYSTPVNFTAGTLSNSGYAFNYAPPDTNGAVGSTNIAELINGQFSVYSKISSGVTNAPVLTETLKSFWKNALGSSAYTAAFTPSGSTTSVGLSDPRLIYDPSTGNWFASSITVPQNSTGVSAANNFLVAESSNPLLGWQGITYNAQPANTTTPEFADFPTLGITANYVTLAGNMYSVPSSLNNFTSAPTNADVLVIPKSSLTAGNANGAALFNQSYNNLGFTNQPVNDFSGNTNHTTYLYSNYDQNSSNTLGYTQNLNQTVVVPGSPPTLDINFNLAKFANQTGGPTTTAAQPGTSAGLDTGDDRLSSSLVLSKGQIWGVQTVANPTNNALSALRVFGVTPTTTNGSSPTITNEMLFTDPNHPNSSLFYGSLAVGTNGTVVLAFNESSSNQYASSYAAVGHISSSGSLSLGTPFLLKAGTTDYSLLTGTYRWGDYSTTVADPTNPNAFWTFQELPSANGTWATQVTEILVPEPTALALLVLGGAALLLRRRSVSTSRNTARTQD